MSEQVQSRSSAYLAAAHAPGSDTESGVRRLNRLPLVIVSILCVVLLAVLVFAGFQRAEQNRSGVGIGGGFDRQLEPVEADRAAHELFQDYREQPAPDVEPSDADWDQLGVPVPPPPSQSEPVPNIAPPLDQFAEQRLELAHDAHLAPTMVPTDNLYQDPALVAQAMDSGLVGQPELGLRSAAPGAFGLTAARQHPGGW